MVQQDLGSHFTDLIGRNLRDEFLMVLFIGSFSWFYLLVYSVHHLLNPSL